MTDLTTANRDGVTVYAVSGRLDLVAGPKLKALIDETIAGGSTFGVIDLGGCDFIDSSGLGAVIGGLKRSREAGGDLRIAAPAGQVTRAIELMKLDRIFGRYASVDEALDGFG
jgi:anti-sigma B factor antagonist